MEKPVWGAFTILVLATVLIALFVIWKSPFLRNDPAEQILVYKDNVESLKFSDTANRPGKLREDTYKLMVFLSADCGGCMEKLPLYEKINQVLCQGQNIELMLMWEDRIPIPQVSKFGLKEKSYTLHNTKISTAYGAATLVDRDNSVLFLESGGYRNTILAVLELPSFSMETMLRSANSYLRSKYGNNGRNLLVYFSMPGCPDCTNATPIVNSKEIRQTYDVVRIELERGAKPTDLVDDLDLFKAAYQIEWYPSFLILKDKDYAIVREIPVNQLKEVLLKN